MNKEPHIDDFRLKDDYDTAWNAWKKREEAHERAMTMIGKSQHEPGAKLDHDKVDMSLLEFLPNALLEVCRVMDYGQTKYTRGGFLEVPDGRNRYTAAMLRHWLEDSAGVKYDVGDPFYDTDAGKPFKGKLRHDAQVAVNALFRLEVTLRKEADDQ